MSFQNIGAVGGGGAAQQSIDPGLAVADNVAGAVGGAAARLGIPQEISDALTQGALSGDQKLFGDALGAILSAAMQAAAQGQSAQGGPSSPAAGPLGASGPAPGAASPSAAGSSGGTNPLELLVKLLSALGVPPQMIEQIVNAVAQNAQAQGAGGAAPPASAVPGVQAA